MSEPTVPVDDQKLMEELLALPAISLRWQRTVGLEVYRPRTKRQPPGKKRPLSEAVACMFVYEEPDQWRWWLRRSDSIEWLPLDGRSTEARLLRWFLGRHDAKRLLKELCAPALESYEALDSIRTLDPMQTGPPVGSPSLILHYRGGELGGGVTHLTCATKPTWLNGSQEIVTRHASPAELAEYASLRKRAKKVAALDWRKLDHERLLAAQKPVPPTEPGYPTMIENEKTGERAAVYSKAEHDAKLATWVRATQPAPATTTPKPEDKQRADDAKRLITPESRLSIRSQLKTTTGFRRKAFADFAGVTEDQLKHWWGRRRAYADGGPVDKAIRAAAARWLRGERKGGR